MDDNYERRKIFAEALNKSLGIIVSESGSDIDTVLSHGLRPIADAAAIDQIIVYRLLGTGHGKHFGQVYRWAKRDGGTTTIIEELRVVPDHPAVDKWLEVCGGGECVNLHTSILSDAEAAFLTRYKAKSLLLSPILIKGELWGAVAFQDHTNERCLDDTSVEFLSSSARICANAFIIDETAKARKRSNDLASALNKMSEIFLTQGGETFEEMMNAGGKLLADLAEVDRFSLLRNTTEDDVLYMSQIYRWEKASGGTTKPNERFVHVAYRKVAPEWENMFKEGKSLNGPVSMMPEREAALSRSIGSRSSYVAPIHINGAPWGFVLFEDHKKERVFADDLTETLHSAAFMFVNAIMRSELESQLASERDFTQKLIDAAPIGLNIWDENLNILTCNDAVEKIFGCTKQYYIDNFFEFSPEYQPDGIKTTDKVNKYLRQFRIGDTVVLNWEHRSITGESIPCELTQTSTVYNNKHVEVVYIYDLRNQKKMEKAVLDAEQTQVLIDAVPLSCILIDKNLNILTCNKTAVDFFKLSKKDDIKRLFDDLVPEYQPDGSNSKETASKEIMKAFDEGYGFYPDWTHIKTDGEPFPCEVMLVRVKYGGDDVIAAYTRDMSAVREAEAKAREAEEWSTLTLNAMPLGSGIWTRDGVMTECNEEAARLFDLKDKNEFIERFGELSPEYQPDGKLSLETAIALVGKAFQEGYCRFEWMHRKLNGEPMPVEVTLIRVKYRDDYRVIGYFRDLSELKESLSKIREADERAQIMFDIAPFAGFMFDKDFNMVDCNQEVVKMFGIPDKEYFLKRHTELFPENQPNGELSSVGSLENTRLALEKGYYKFEYMHRKMNGNPLPAEITLVRVRYRGEYILAGYMRDLTEQKIAEQLTKIIAEKTSTLTTLFNSTTDMIFCKDINLRYTECNKAMEDFFNIRNSDIAGKSESEALHMPPEIAKQLIDRDKKIIAEKQTIISEELVKSGDGTMVYFEMVRSPLIQEGEVIGLVGMARDITQRKKMIQLSKQQAEAEAASRAKSSFLATMSHEMRTPMNAIIGMTTIGKNAESTERKDYAFDKIGDAAMHLLSVINDVLDISKIEANKMELSPVEFNFERMLQKIVNIINFRMDEKRQIFTLNVGENIPRFVVGDDHRLSQVIMNLLSNAVKFSPEQGEIGLDVTLSGENDGICELRITVSDNGIGISGEQQAKLFSAFEQADSGITREFGGTGLGLSISKHIVELMGGEIWVESELRKGSRFVFTVKVERGKKNIASMLASGIKRENMRVLVVDDESGICAYFENLFAQLVIRCDVAFDGFEACRIIEETGSYDIYFIDWRMPGMDGIELTRKIKAHDKERPSVVVMISSADWAVIREMAIDAGVSKYLLKPLFSSAIIDCINECLGLGNAGSEEDAENNVYGRFAGKKLLVVEDVDINREIVVSLLEDTGVSIDCAENGLDAVEMIVAAPGKYDVILMDIQMPKMDGLEATRLIRALTGLHLKHLPIIAMTAHVFTDDVEECLAAGMDDHIGKPLDIDDLMVKLNKYFNSPKSGGLV